MSNKPLLSICIPTYNGASSSLDLVLESAIEIAKKYDGIEIVVSDNCSKDNTQQLVLAFQKKYPSLRYHRNSENLGFNGNMLGVANLAKGEYAWMTGDDDVINLSTFGTIYNTLKDGLLDYISIRFQFSYKEDYFIDDSIDDNVIINTCSFAEVLNNNCFRGNTLATFMGSSIVRLQMFLSVPTDIIENKFDNYYNCFPNAYMVATAFHSAKCAYTTTPCITCVSPKNHKKTYENLSSWAIIDTKAIVELYDYVVSLGVDRKYLKTTEDRIIYDNIVTGTKVLFKQHRIAPNFFRCFFSCLSHYRVIGALFKIMTNTVFKTKYSIDI